jgi:hypothetical protein
MASSQSFKRAAPDLRGLLAACRENEAILPDLSVELAFLEQGLAKATTLWDRQKSFTASRQEATQQLKTTMQECLETAEKLRDLVKGKIGRRNERLVQFKVAPLRKPTRKAAAVKQPPPEPAE